MNMNRKELIKLFTEIPCNTIHDIGQRAMNLIRAEQRLHEERRHKKIPYTDIILHALEICYSEEVE